MNLWQRLTGGAGGARYDVASPFAGPSHLETVDASLLAELYGTDAADLLPVSRAQAMTIPAVARIRTLLCSTVARMPLLAYDGAGVMPTQPALCRQPEAGRPAFQTWLWLTDQLFFHGAAYALTVAGDGRTDRATGFQLIPNHLVDLDDTGQPVGVDGTRYPSSRFVRFDGPHEGVLTFGARTMRAALALEAAAGRVADNPVPAIELHQTAGDDLTPDEIDALIARWSAARRKRTGGVAFTNQAVEVKTHGAPAEHLMSDGRRAIALDLARLCSAPAWVIDANESGSAITYANTTDRMRDFLDWCAGAYVSAIEARMSADDLLAAGVWARFDAGDLTRGSLKDQADGYAAAQAAGILTQEESAALFRGRPLEVTE